MKKLSPREKFELVRTLKQQGKSRKQISEETGIPKSTTESIIRASKKGFDSITQLNNYRARQRVNPETGKPYNSVSELKNYRARQRVNPETGEKFKSLSELHYYQARQRVNPETGKPFESPYELQVYQTRQKGYKNFLRMRMALHNKKRPRDLLDRDCKKRGYTGVNNYNAIRRTLNKNLDTQSCETTKPIEELVYLESIGRASFPRVYQSSSSQDRIDEIVNNLGILTKRSRDIIIKRLSGVTLEEIGKSYGLTREAIRQIEVKAIKKLKNLYKRLNPDEETYTPRTIFPRPFWESSETQIQRRKAKNPEKYSI